MNLNQSSTTLMRSVTRVTTLEVKLSEIEADDMPEDFYHRASRILRGGDGGDHGLLLYKLLSKCFASARQSVVLLDVGTARGFSAIAMAKAMMDADLRGEIYTIDIIGQDEPRGWHVAKQQHDEPLVGIEMSRSGIWCQWYKEEAELIHSITGRSSEVLESWNHGDIAFAFIDGDHRYHAVKADLEMLDILMAEGGQIVLDDYHTGISATRIPLPSRIATLTSYYLERCLGKIGTRPANILRSIFGNDNEYIITRHKFYGVKKAIHEFLEERPDRWSLEIITMPSRGDYQGDDYSLALLTMKPPH